MTQPEIESQSPRPLANTLPLCQWAKHVITDKSKFINFDQNFEPRNNFVELANRN